jgi:prolyl 4-hydroxylase
MNLHKQAEGIFTIEGFWPKEECALFIEASEMIGYEPATVNTDTGVKRVEGSRNNERVIYEDKILAQKLWMLLESHAPNKIGNSCAVGLNELFRFYKYLPGQQFKKHRDESFIRNEEEASYYTFMIYLNDEYTGGVTNFNEVSIKPSCGMALLFRHDLEHAGSPVIDGVKYVLRTDVMYRLKQIA